jgi:hypothetical protein
MSGLQQPYTDPTGIECPASFLAPVSFSANAGEGHMAVTFNRYVDASKADKEPLQSFNTTVPLNGHALELLTTLLAIIYEAATSEIPPTGLEGATPA